MGLFESVFTYPISAQSLRDCVLKYKQEYGVSADEAIRQCRQYETPKRYPNLGGIWKVSWGNPPWTIQHDSVSNEFTVFLPNRRGPFLGWINEQNEIFVEFTDDRGCCTGILNRNATEIRWSNGSIWRR